MTTTMTREKCRYCGRKLAPGPLRNHEKSCELNPGAGYQIAQPRERCPHCGRSSTAAGIANQGTVMRPYIVDEVQSPSLEVLEQTQPEEFTKNAVSTSTADQLTDLMVYTVDEGTAAPAAIDGVSVAGKTGTAQSGQVGRSPYAWFVSFAPANDPQVAVAVMIQKADIEAGEIAGGLLGGPIAKSVMEAVIQ